MYLLKNVNFRVQYYFLLVIVIVTINDNHNVVNTILNITILKRQVCYNQKVRSIWKPSSSYEKSVEVNIKIHQNRPYMNAVNLTSSFVIKYKDIFVVNVSLKFITIKILTTMRLLPSQRTPLKKRTIG